MKVGLLIIISLFRKKTIKKRQLFAYSKEKFNTENSQGLLNNLDDKFHIRQARNQEFFKAGGFSRNQGMSINILSTTHERKAQQGKNMGFFPLETLKTTFKIRNLTQDGHNQGILLQNQDTFFQFLKKARGDLPPSTLQLHACRNTVSKSTK